MRTFIDANSGLASRFNHYVEFPDYSAEELAEMFRSNAKHFLADAVNGQVFSSRI